MKKRIGRYLVEITNPDKILLPKKITKGALIEYYDKIAEHMIPYMKNRALIMHRFPDGLEGESFYQKDASAYFPTWIKTVLIPKEGGYNNSVVCQNHATLVYLANQACITPHLWLSRIDKLHFPDRLIFDFDPAGDDFSTVRFLALALKELLDTLGLIAFVMTSGSRGLHVIVPLSRTLEFKQVKAFATCCAEILVHAYPEKATLEIRKEKRGERVFIDTLRNHYGATSVAPFAIRAKRGAPIATPLHWYEIDDASLSPQKYTITNIFKRLKALDDPWKELLTLRQSLKKPMKKITGA